MPEPINPTRIIPAGWPTPRTAPPLPLAPHDATDLPPWRTAAPPPAPPPPPRAAPVVAAAASPPPIVVHVHIPEPPPDEPEPERSGWDFGWLWRWARPWSSLAGAVLVLGPWFGGRSIVSAWAATLAEARTEAGILPAYLIAGGVLTTACVLDWRRAAWWTRALLIVALIGGTGALDWFDVATALTGVHR